ncbi:hypothetical protein BU15DRAFT_80856 [Melanogaster broomeanus]|nr:hypothetical protein BU15DRAFT_80856 [Melanogaster broomeanus]
MFQNADKEGLMVKEALAGKIMETETTEVVKETLAWRRWVTLCWTLTWWIPSPFLKWEKLVLNLVIWFICGCAIFVIAILALRSSYQNSLNNVYTSIRGEVFDLMQIAATHQRVISVVPMKSVLQYGGTAADNLFPIQVSALCNGINGTVSPWVQVNSANNTDINVQYYDFHAITNDSRPDWHFESMTLMRWNNRVGYVGYTPQEITNMVNTRYSLGIYNSLIYDLTACVNSGPSVVAPYSQQAPTTDSQFIDTSIVNLFQQSSRQDVTKMVDALPLDVAMLDQQKPCLRNLFLIGMVDN